MINDNKQKKLIWSEQLNKRQRF